MGEGYRAACNSVDRCYSDINNTAETGVVEEIRLFVRNGGATVLVLLSIQSRAMGNIYIMYLLHIRLGTGNKKPLAAPLKTYNHELSRPISSAIGSAQTACYGKGEVKVNKEFINALYVERNGVYSEIENIELWDIERDARVCKNGVLAVAHPPCDRWGRYWGGGPSVKVKKLLGDDNGCFAHALWYIRTFGGVIEHPEGSHAWPYYGLTKPPKRGGWIKADAYGGLTCCVEQGNYGHKARKATWLYINKINAIELIWGKAENKIRMEEGFHGKEAARMARTHPDYKPVKRLSAQERIDTPIEFRDLLITMCAT